MQRATFHTLYDAHARDVFRFARYLTGDADAAADITSETFLRAWAGRDAVRVETARAYLLAIARNLCRDRGRQAKQWPTAPMPERVVPPDAETRLELDRVLAAIDTLPIEYREPLVLAASGVAYDEIARMLGIAAGTVKIRVHRARLKLAAATEGAPVETT
ncbi:MAG TPA: RNA polymerase sigma factor [Vicinamibacterales bacterium]|jgi:RNA polymerase sigma-70 factor (ECF subfamily)|nr:RNA polymerase sigma factor [Vicinamibacterales bacterium]